MSSVHVVLFNSEGKVCLVKRRDIPVWVLPGGGIEPYETPEQAGYRELFEETGIKASTLILIGHYTPLCKLAKESFVFMTNEDNYTTSLNNEVSAIEFFDTQSLPYHLPPPFPDWIEDAKNFTTEPFNKPIRSVTYGKFFYYLLRHPFLVIRFILSRFGIHLNK